MKRNTEKVVTRRQNGSTKQYIKASNDKGMAGICGVNTGWLHGYTRENGFEWGVRRGRKKSGKIGFWGPEKTQFAICWLISSPKMCTFIHLYEKNKRFFGVVENRKFSEIK